MLKICNIGLENTCTVYLIETSKLYSKIEKSGKSKKDVCLFPPP